MVSITAGVFLSIGRRFLFSCEIELSTKAYPLDRDFSIDKRELMLGDRSISFYGFSLKIEFT